VKAKQREKEKLLPFHLENKKGTARKERGEEGSEKDETNIRTISN
jgi:hypothetical protein